ncbi:MAG: PAS domain-containing protein [Arenicella sp.]|nr:PAS domain-containing protein [Arenicella sp.]
MTTDIIIENLRAAVLLVDNQQIVRSVNLAAETMFLQSRRSLIGQPLDAIVPVDSVRRCVSDCLLNNTQYTLREIEIELSDDEVLVDISLTCVNTPGVDPSVLIEINSINRISRFMREENQLERQQSFRLMMRSLAHEIKNPLGGIRGAAQLLQRETNDPGKTHLTEILIKEADRLTRLVDRVMGSRDQLKIEQVNIHEVLEHVLQLTQASLNQEILPQRDYDPTLPEIALDREQMIQAVLNIVGNAVEAQPEAEQIRLGFSTKFERFVTLNREMFRQVLKIAIWDEGPGIPENIKDVIFDPLISGRADGSGLGLSLTHEIVQRHKGTVQLEDVEGRTCFSIYLPYINGEPDGSEEVLT